SDHKVCPLSQQLQSSECAEAAFLVLLPESRSLSLLPQPGRDTQPLRAYCRKPNRWYCREKCAACGLEDEASAPHRLEPKAVCPIGGRFREATATAASLYNPSRDQQKDSADQGH